MEIFRVKNCRVLTNKHSCRGTTEVLLRHTVVFDIGLVNYCTDVFLREFQWLASLPIFSFGKIENETIFHFHFLCKHKKDMDPTKTLFLLKNLKNGLI